MFLLTGSARLLVIVLHSDCFSYFILVVCSFPLKIKIMISTINLVQNFTKALGGIKDAITQISTDSTLAEHIHLLLMGSTGSSSEVIITP